MEIVGVVAFLRLSIYFAKVGKPILGSILLDIVGDALSIVTLSCTSNELMCDVIILKYKKECVSLKLEFRLIFKVYCKHGFLRYIHYFIFLLS